MKKAKKRNIVSSVILTLILVAGLSLLLYPTISNWWNSTRSTQAISNYHEVVDTLKEEEYTKLLEDAKEYNKSFYRHYLNRDEQKVYENLLNIGGNGMMGYVVIPKIDVKLPIYHGTAESVLQIAAGHLEWSSLPVGGESTHCILSGHRGLPSAKLFTDLDQMAEGDLFQINILNETFTYEVDQILVVKPEETDDLQIIDGRDYCTLVTCTPYGINTHRLLVRGHRVENIDDTRLHVPSDAVQIDNIVVAVIIAVPILLIVFGYVLIRDKKRKSSKRYYDND